MRWRDLRAGLIGLAVVLGLVDGCPLPPPNLTPAWQRPIRTLQKLVERPVAWIAPMLQIGQLWAVYQAPGGQRYRLTIDGRDATGAWQLLFRAGDPEHAEDAAVITSPRVTGTWQPSDVATAMYPRFADWIAARMLARHTELVAVRVRMEKITIIAGGFTSSGDYAWTHVRERVAP